ncbi:MAG: ribonuclease III domain-containing protein [Bacillota bacterium]|nr:ribonuclease III domain-containing protein [Bacillota bacterium]
MIFNYFGKKLSPEEARRMNGLTLAYIGDAVYEVMVREYLVVNNQMLSAHKLHLKAVSYVKAHSQSEMFKSMEGQLSEEEISIYKKGRNSKSPTMPKNASVTDYRAATGLEALVGYLYITGQVDRLELIMKNVFKDTEI